MDKKRIGLISAVFIGISSIIGSGSLFVPYRTAVLAGPAAIIAWLLSGGLILLLALCMVELAVLYPKRGLTAIIPTLSHNKFFGFPFAITNWLGVVAVIGLEADASVQYLINLLPQFKDYLYVNEQLTLPGNMLSIALVILYCAVNYWGAKTLVKANNILAVLKILIPTVTGLVIIAVAFHPHNFTLINNSFIPYGVHSIFSAILMSGILVSFNGFQSIVSFASEIKSPEKTICWSLVLSILFCLAIYLLLQIAFIGAVPADMLAKTGWAKIQMSAPMSELAVMIGLNLFTSIIYFGAMITPSGAGITFTGSAARMFTAMTRKGQMPEFLGKIDPVYHISRRSLLLNVGLALIFLLTFRSWARLAEFLSLFHIISYLPIPLALCIFRSEEPREKYSFRLWGGHGIALFVFAAFTYLLTLSHLKIISQIFIFLGVCQILFIAFNVKSTKEFLVSIRQTAGLIIYFAGLWALTYLSAAPYVVVGFAVIAFYALTIKWRPKEVAPAQKRLITQF